MNILKFLGLQKKPLTTEQLFNKCEESFYDFCSYIHLSHTREFHEFKKKFAKDAEYCISAIVEVKEDELKRKLINHLQKQVDYLHDNSFGPNSRVKHREFMEANYPYEEKVNKVIKDHYMEKKIVPPTTNKIKMK